MVHHRRRNKEATTYQLAFIIIFAPYFLSFSFTSIPTVFASSNPDNFHKLSCQRKQNISLKHEHLSSDRVRDITDREYKPFKRRKVYCFDRIFSIQNGGAIYQKPKQYCQQRLGALVSRKKRLSSLKGGVQANPQLLNLFRLIYVTYYASLGALMPYLPVYFHSLGHDGRAIGILGSVKPITTFLVAPIWGIVSDYMQNPDLILQLTFVTSFLFQSLLPLKNDVKFLVRMVFITALFNAPVKSLIDSMVLNKLSDEDRGQYGKLRLWGQLGFGLGSSFVGYLMGRSASNAPSFQHTPQPSAERIVHDAMDIANTAGASAAARDSVTMTALETLSEYLSSSVEMLLNISGYKIAFLAHALLSLPVFLCLKVFQFNYSENKPPSKSDKVNERQKVNILEGVNLLFHNGDAILFFFLVFVVGTTSGIIENFAYVRLREVGGTGKEMGVCRLASSLAGAPMFWFSARLTDILGVDRVLVISLLSYMIRFLNYALIRNPYHALPAEALRGVTFAAFWSTGTVYAHKISPKGMSATMLMFMNAMYGGLGQSLGAIVGGKLQSIHGTVKTFLYAAGFDFAFICFVTIYLGFRQESNFRNPTPIKKKVEV